ncbi:uncharacterized protein LOC125532717 [Triticum urartu]|nr:uncharacterized protein LOC125532717 [Triticum urartu]
MAAWLPIAARRISGDLLLVLQTNIPDYEVWERGALELPCFENATSITLELEGLGLTMPPSGIFARLTNLQLGCIRLRGPSMLGEAVSSPRCPALQKLTLSGTSGLGNLTIHSESLLEMTLTRVHGLQQLNVTAPTLKQLEVLSCFTKGRMILILPVANISAPQLESLMWWDDSDPKFTQLGKMENLQCLSTFPFTIYEETDHVRELQNSYCTRLLRRFELIHSLRFQLVNDLEDIITNQQYLMEDITGLPDITFMFLDITGNGHSFVPSSFHLLRMCTGLRKLSLTFCGTTIRPEVSDLKIVMSVENEKNYWA